MNPEYTIVEEIRMSREDAILKMFEATNKLRESNQDFYRYWETVNPINRDLFLAAIANAIFE